MEKLTVFYLQNCPYCKKAKEALEELKTENPSYGNVEMEWIEESVHPEIADKYDYYRVPSIFRGNEKLYECDPSHDYDEIKRQFGLALAAAAEE